MIQSRRQFLGLLAGGAVMSAGAQQAFKKLNDYLKNENSSSKLPALFIGHGSPMNAIADNPYTQTLTKLGKKISTPKAILVISAHWMTEGSWITEMPKPKTIHDFYGFPQALFDVQYPAPGSPEMALLIRESVINTQIQSDTHNWGLDHGTWSVLKHMYPEAHIPVLQLSLNMAKSPDYHFQLGQELSQLRQKGVLIIGSGNLVHNLRALSWDENAKPHEWAIEFDEWIKQKIITRDYKSIMYNYADTAAGRLSVPSLDHYYPLHYILGTSSFHDEISFEFEEIQNASISMRCFSIGSV